jgi:hypothetical protein
VLLNRDLRLLTEPISLPGSSEAKNHLSGRRIEHRGPSARVGRCSWPVVVTVSDGRNAIAEEIARINHPLLLKIA